jgi:chromosomal replication initiator protein
VLDGITRRRMGPVREHFRTADALLMDDMEFLLISPRAQEELLHTFDLLLAAGRQLVFSMGRYPRAMTGLGDALRSRLEMGLLTELTYPDTATRLCLLEAKSRADGIALPPEVARLLADRITRNLRQLEGALVRLGAYAALEGCPITREFAQRVAAPFFDPQPGGKRSVASDAVVEAVAEQFGLTVRVLKGRSRSPSVVGARRVAIHLLKQLAGLSYSEIGACLGTRSHSTVLHGHHRMLDDLKGDGPLKRTVLHLEHRLLDASGGDPVGAGIAPE